MLQIIASFMLVLLAAVSARAESHYWGGQRVVTQIAVTAATPTGNFGAAGSEFWTRYVNAMAVSCPAASGWYPCTISNIREAMANQVTGWNTINTCSWVNAFDVTPAYNYASATTTTNCDQWTATTGLGMTFCPPAASSGNDSGFALTACTATRTLLCCK